MERAKLAKESTRELLVGRSRVSAEQNVAGAPSSAGKKVSERRLPEKGHASTTAPEKEG
jgi:hypothetical protein